MSISITHLNDPQRAAVTTVDKHVLVLAGAGSGKTGVITRKIAWMVDREVSAAKEIVGVTFTNKAAREMKQRLGTLLPKKACDQVRVSTFHRLGLRLLHRYAISPSRSAGTGAQTAQSNQPDQGNNNFQLRRGFSIFDGNDSRQIVKDILQDNPTTLDDRVITSRISTWKNELINPQTALIRAEDGQDAAIAKIYEDYQRMLNNCNAVDFDDLIRLPVELMRADPVICQDIQNGISQLLVDEVQDTNNCQYALIKLLMGEQAVLTAVGDDDQSIYSWRGANPENLNALARDLPDLQVIKLEQNYRSSQRILRCANAVIAKNPHLFEKQLWSDLGIGENLRLSYCRDSVDEAQWIAADILTQQFRHSVKNKDIAILYRSNFQSRPIEQALRESGISYHVSGGSSFFDTPEVKDLLSYLRLLTNPSDDTALLRVINRPRREIGAKTLEKIGLVAGLTKNSLFDTCFEPSLTEHITPRAAKQVSDFANCMVLMADNARRGDPVAVIRDLLERIDFDGWLADESSSPASLQRARDNVDEMLNWIERLVQAATPETQGMMGTTETSGESTDFASLVAHISLMDMLSRNQEKNELSGEDGSRGGDVHLMTMHAAKGLEFSHVYIPGMEEGILPHHSAAEDPQVEEERRLAYVGMTRAKHRLTFTVAQARSRFGDTTGTTPSRFLDEIPVDDLDRLGNTPNADSQQQNLVTGRETLDSLRALLDDASA